MPATARGTFEVRFQTGPAELGGAVTRQSFTKTFRGDLEGTGSGLMLSCGSPRSGSAGYVAIEIVDGSLSGRSGRFALQQLGMMHAGEQTLHYEVVPGAGEGELSGLTGSLTLIVEPGGIHRYVLGYEL